MTIETLSNEPKIETPPVKAAEDKTPVQTGSESVAENNTPAESTSLDSETEETEATNESEAESTESEPEGADAADLSSKEPAKKKSGFQRRIDKLNLAKAKAQQEADFWKEQALKGAGEKKETPVETPKLAAADGKPDPSKYETHADFVEALTDWKTEQKFKEHGQKQVQDQLQTEQAKQVQSYVEKRDAFKTTHTDFDELMEDVADIPVSLVVQDIIITSEHGPALAYELAKNKEEFARINKLSPMAAARELGRLEAKFSSQASQEKKTETKTTKAPAPLAPVRGSSAAVPKSLQEAAEHSFQAYKKQREAELKKQGRRI
jgi:hypothetical protein